LGLASEIGIIAVGNRVVGWKFVLGVGTEIVSAVITLACHKYKEPKIISTAVERQTGRDKTAASSQPL
jgi:hypothetical protein